jgi:deoxycytidylate deaminase
MLKQMLLQNWLEVTTAVWVLILFVTHSPCLDCAKLIYQSGIKRVWYGAEYRNSDGI